MSTPALKVALTGGIGSGKTTAARFFSELGMQVVDADEVSHHLTATPEVLHKIIEHFGEAYLTPERTLNRQKLKQRIFGVPEDRQWLEQLLHPVIILELKRRASAAQGSYIIFVIPLLAAKNQLDFIDRIAVVDAGESFRIKRLQDRDPLSIEEIEKIIATQPSREHYLSLADDIISNEGGVQSLRQQVNMLHLKYLQLSHSTTAL